MFVKMDCFVCLICITWNNGGKAMEFCCWGFLTGQHLGHKEVRAAVWLQGLMEEGQSGKIRNVLLWFLCKHLSSMSPSDPLNPIPWILPPQTPQAVFNTPSTANLPHSPASVQHPPAGTIPPLHWVQLCSFVLLWRFLFHHCGFRAGILILAVWLAGFHQRHCTSPSSWGLGGFCPCPIVSGLLPGLWCKARTWEPQH